MNKIILNVNPESLEKKDLCEGDEVFVIASGKYMGKYIVDEQCEDSNGKYIECHEPEEEPHGTIWSNDLLYTKEEIQKILNTLEIITDSIKYDLK